MDYDNNIIMFFKFFDWIKNNKKVKKVVYVVVGCVVVEKIYEDVEVMFENVFINMF